MDISEFDDRDHHAQLKVIIRRTVGGFIMLFLVYGLLFLFMRESLLQAGSWLGEYLGLPGIGIYCFLVDMFIVPATIDVVFPFTLSWPAVPLLAVMGIASMLGGFCGYLLARTFNRLEVVHALTRAYQENGRELIRKYGGWAVVIAGLTPVPFSTVCWIAGLLELPPHTVLLATASRIPRIIIYYLLIQAGVSLFGLIPVPV
ncbi:MAG: VTT domain-containing protein [Spirochaetia bacterium]|nr:VTT domain-containing protein [Spirochaetia bacterium]MCF7940666.1 VTT domain-containing protein [Spirochaetia bacterium]